MQIEPVVAIRSVTLPVSAEDVWASVRDAAGLAGWLGDAVDLEVAPGAAGTITDGDATRRVVVTDVDEGRALRFTWWDEAEPNQVSTVELDLHEVDGETTVTVTERLLGGAVASVADASVAQLDDIEARWDRRLQALVADAALLPAAV